MPRKTKIQIWKNNKGSYLILIGKSLSIWIGPEMANIDNTNNSKLEDSLTNILTDWDLLLEN